MQKFQKRVEAEEDEDIKAEVSNLLREVSDTNLVTKSEILVYKGKIRKVAKICAKAIIKPFWLLMRGSGRCLKLYFQLHRTRSCKRRDRASPVCLWPTRLKLMMKVNKIRPS